MKRILICVALMLMTVNAHAARRHVESASSFGPSMNLNLFVGNKTMDSDWEPLDDQGEVGLMFDYRESDWPVSLAIEFMGSSDSAGGKHYYSDKLTGKTSELCLGIKKIWDIPGNVSFHPFIGGGLAYITGEINIDAYDYSDYYYDYYLRDSDKDSAFGFWISGGFYATIARHFNIGIMGRVSRAKVTLFNHDYEAGGNHIGLLVGYHF